MKCYVVPTASIKAPISELYPEVKKLNFEDIPLDVPFRCSYEFYTGYLTINTMEELKVFQEAIGMELVIQYPSYEDEGGLTIEIYNSYRE